MSGVNKTLVNALVAGSTAVILITKQIPAIDGALQDISNFMENTLQIRNDRAQAITLWLSTGVIVLPQIVNLPRSMWLITI